MGCLLVLSFKEKTEESHGEKKQPAISPRTDVAKQERHPARLMRVNNVGSKSKPKEKSDKVLKGLSMDSRGNP